MAYSISVSKRTNGGYTIVTEGGTYYPSDLIYHGTSVGVTLYSRGLTTSLYKPSEWTIQTVTGYTTVVQVCDALDALGIVSVDVLEDIKGLLTTIDADTGNLAAIKVALEIMDDWDENDRAKVTDQIESKRLTASITRPADTTNYDIGDAVQNAVAAATEFTNAARLVGKGGYLNEVKVETDAVQFASKTIRLWLFNDTPASIVNDNAAFINNFANAAKRMCYIDVVFDALLAGSDTVFGRAMPSQASGSGIVPYNYMCGAAGTSIYMLIQTLSAVTTPKSGGVFNFYFNTVQL